MSAFEFQPESDGTLPLSSAVFQALGAASTCWEHMEGTGVFQDQRAVEIGEALLKFIEQEMQKNHVSRLGEDGAA